MKRVLALVLVLCAGSAEGRTLYLSPVGSDSSTTYTSSSGTPLRTLTKALTICQTNDTLKLGNSAGVIASGKYAAAFVPPDQYQSYQGLTVLGDSTARYRTVLSGINITVGASASSPRYCANITFNGIVVDGSVNITRDDYLPGDIDGFMMRNCTIREQFYAEDVSHALYKCRVGVNLTAAGASTDSTSSKLRLYAANRPVYARYDSTRFLTGPRTADAFTDYALEMHSSNIPALAMNVEATRCTFRLFMPEGWDPQKPTFMKGLNGSRFTDCLWQIADSSNNSSFSADDNAGFLFRDGQIDNVFHRNTWDLHTFFPGKGRGSICFSGSGNFTPGRGNVHRFSTFKSNIPIDKQLNWHWQIQAQDSFYFNTVLLSTSGASDGIYINNVSGNAYFGNNTLVNYGTGGVMNVNVEGDADCNFMQGKLTFENNIVYSQSTGTTSADYGMGIQWRQVQRNSDSFGSDYNLYSHYGSASGLRSLYAAPCFATKQYLSPDSIMTLYGIEKNSLHGSPRFTDSTFANFNGTLLANSAGRCVGRNGESMGAVNSDCIRPEEVDDLRATSAGPTTVLLAWTATGDDSTSGTATTYDIRHYSLPITEINWASATAVTGEPTPSVAGTLETDLITGLTANTLYYFAIKVSDEYGNTSILSNVASRTTPASGPDLGEP